MGHMFYGPVGPPGFLSGQAAGEREAAFDLTRLQRLPPGRARPGRWPSGVRPAVLVQATLLQSARFVIVAGSTSLRQKRRQIIERRRQRPDRRDWHEVMVETLKVQTDPLEQM